MTVARPVVGQTAAAPSSGFATFVVLWAGQLVSSLGSGLTGFALGVWVFRSTGSATHFALLTFFAVLPAIVVSPFAGALVDRWDRRWAMILADAGAAVGTAALLVLAWRGEPSLPLVYLVVAGSAVFSALQMPAFLSSVPLLVAKRHLGRTAGMTQLASAVPKVVAPLLAGALLAGVGLRAVLLADLATFAFALATLLVVRIPRPPRQRDAPAGSAGRSLLREAAYGWVYLRERPGMLVLLAVFAVVNFALGTLQALLTPLVLSFASVEVLGVVLSVASAGLVAGSLTMSVWGGPRRRVPGILVAVALQAAILFLAGIEPSATLIGAAAFAYLFFVPIISGCGTAIWQTKVEPAVQGRVFAVQKVVSWSSLPLAFLVAGPLADHVFEPLMSPGGALAGSLGRLLGVGPGRGIAVMFLGLALVVLAAVAVASRVRRLRELEREIPDAVEEAASTRQHDREER